MTQAMTVAEHLDYLLPGASRREKPPQWPPDIFAISASLLAITGGYCVVSCNWPPRVTWASSIQTTADAWRKGWRLRVPQRVTALWKQITAANGLPIAKLSGDRKLCIALVELLAIADEASAGVGIPYDPAYGDDLSSHAEVLLADTNDKGGANLCAEVRVSAARVLPKMHVPQSGFTLRSLSHYLALVPHSEIMPFWHPVGTAPVEDRTLDILILPWPLYLSSASFKKVAATKATMRNMPSEYGFFEFQHTNSAELVEDVLNTVLCVASRFPKMGIDIVVMPELSLNQKEYRHLSSALVSKGIQLIAGVGGERNADGTTHNSVRFDIPFNIPGVAEGVSTMQMKHHRWKLDPNQVANYGLTLPKTKQLWEHIPIKDRTVAFICIREWLALCVLICEDLARPDPVGDLIRSIGPNLVIALLLDGPQLTSRWSGRYATALADDPGSSVLTLTCAGMTALSKPPRGNSRGRGKVALWKDFRGQTKVIDIGDGDAALLHVEVLKKEGWTADGRSDGKSSGYPVLKSYSIFKNRKYVNNIEVI